MISIVFSPPSVRAIRDGTKDVTRRVVDPQPPAGCLYELNGAGTHALCRADDGRGAHARSVWVPPTPTSVDHRLPCPYSVGDRLRVLEAWATSPDGAVLYSSTDTIPWGLVRHHARAMPPELARTFLEVVSVRVERLHAIDDRDAVREGMRFDGGATETPRAQFADHWDVLHGDGAWARNDDVWRIEFRIVEGPKEKK